MGGQIVDASLVVAPHKCNTASEKAQIEDRLSFLRFLGWDWTARCRMRLVKARAIEKLFACLDAVLTDRGYLAIKGKIIDTISCQRRSNLTQKRRRSRSRKAESQGFSGIWCSGWHNGREENPLCPDGRSR